MLMCLLVLYQLRSVSVGTLAKRDRAPCPATYLLPPLSESECVCVCVCVCVCICVCVHACVVVVVVCVCVHA